LEEIAKMENIAKMEAELDQARADFRDSLNQISRRVHAVGLGLPDSSKIVRRNPLAWVGGALTTGYLMGRARRSDEGGFGLILFGGLLGFIVDRINHDFKRERQSSLQR
jgi:hypothetical protein